MKRLVLAVALIVTPAQAGTVTSKAGAKANVSAKYVIKFQAYIRALEARGAIIKFLGGIRRGTCSLASQHPCGSALDVCQTARGRVDSRCRLPSRAAMISIAASVGLFEGGQWCNQDMGHVQVIPTPTRCSANLYTTLERVKRQKGVGNELQGPMVLEHGTKTQ